MLKYSEINKIKEQLTPQKAQQFFTDTTNEIAQRVLRKTIQRTPVGKSHPDYVGGTLRKHWRALSLKQTGSSYKVEITNPIEYAEYVEYGHRTRNHKKWVPGRFMLTTSVNDIQKIAPALIEKRLKEALGK